MARVEVANLPPFAGSPSPSPGLDGLRTPTGGLQKDQGLRPIQAGGPLASLTQRPIAIGPQAAGLHFGFNGFLPNNWTPPDVQVAAGPDHVVEMVNSIGGVWTKDGSQISVFPLSQFFFVPNTDFIFDPKVLYDGVGGRWFASEADGTTGRVLLAVSESGNPMGGWVLYNFTASKPCPDQPTLGVSGDKVAFSTNDFSSCSNSGIFLGAEYWILNKGEVLRGSDVHYAKVGPDAKLSSVHPVQALSSTTQQYLVSSNDTSSSVLKLFTVVGVPPGPLGITVTNLGITMTIPPPSASQRGTPFLIDTGDDRVLDAKWFQDSLWVALGDACHPDGDPVGRACLRLIQVDTATKSVRQDFDLGAFGTYYFYPALSLDSLGDLLVVFGFSSSGDYPGIKVTAQGVEDPARSLAAPLLLIEGAGIQAIGCSADRVCRYGDYFGAALDPSDPTLAWVAGEYGTSSGWATSVGSMRVRAALTVGYSVLGGGSGYQGPVLTYTFQGKLLTPTLGGPLETHLADVGTSWTLTNPLAGSSSLERWHALGLSSGDVGSSLTRFFSFYHQYYATFDYSVLYGGSGYSAPTATLSSFGLQDNRVAGGSAWADAGTTYVYQELLPGSSASERWWASARSGTVTSSTPAMVEYRHQYLVTLAVNPADGRGGSVSAGGGWHNASESARISVKAAPGWRLQGWAGSGSGSYVGSSESAMVQVDSAINETATFYPGLTITASTGGSVTFSYEGGSGSVPAGTSRTIYVRRGTNVSVAAAPTLLYAFAGWKGVTGNMDRASIVVDSPTNLTADFSLSTFAIVTSPYVPISAAAVVVAFIAAIALRRRTHKRGP